MMFPAANPPAKKCYPCLQRIYLSYPFGHLPKAQRRKSLPEAFILRRAVCPITALKPENLPILVGQIAVECSADAE